MAAIPHATGTIYNSYLQDDDTDILMKNTHAKRVNYNITLYYFKVYSESNTPNYEDSSLELEEVQSVLYIVGCFSC